ncbi:MAG: FAD-dependent oxidoreductase [Acidimicrobiia bacterium]|nr:FAD-dependent oxidoreductase [Acidimicrobiia bacterium]
MDSYQTLSLWHDTAGEALVPRSALPSSTVADVVIVGAGYTGLWTAYYLKKLEPDLRVVVVEAEIAGYGASGRNGGWCAGEIAGNRDRMAIRHGRQAVRELWRAMFATVDEVGRVAAEEGIDCDFHKGGILTFATNPAQVTSLQEELDHDRGWGFGEADFRWLGRNELPGRVRDALGAIYTPHAAAIHPLRLVRGLAKAAERLGVQIYEQTRVDEISPGQVKSDHGSVKADVVLRATEAFTISLIGHERDFVPAYSLMVATEPLPAAFWDMVGFAEREVFNDARHLIIYGQRTADGRLAFGGRGARYHFRSQLRAEYDRQPKVHHAVEAVLRNLFPDLGAARITHRWGGAVALARDWRPSVFFDRASGVGDAGGYAGEGVAASNLAGRTLADLVLGRDTDLTRLPWVGHRSRRWEPEPLRWVGANLATSLARTADRIETRRGRPARLVTSAFRLLTGR